MGKYSKGLFIIIIIIEPFKLLIYIILQVEPGLTDDMYQDDESKEDTKDFLAGSSRLKEV